MWKTIARVDRIFGVFCGLEIVSRGGRGREDVRFVLVRFDLNSIGLIFYNVIVVVRFDLF